MGRSSGAGDPRDCHPLLSLPHPLLLCPMGQGGIINRFFYPGLRTPAKAVQTRCAAPLWLGRLVGWAGWKEGRERIPGGQESSLMLGGLVVGTGLCAWRVGKCFHAGPLAPVWALALEGGELGRTRRDPWREQDQPRLLCPQVFPRSLQSQLIQQGKGAHAF